MQISQKCSVAIHCLIFLREYGDVGNVTSGLLARSTGCNPVIIRSTISSLRKAGIVTVKPGVGNIRLAKAPEEITLLDLCDALEPSCFRRLMGVHPHPSPLCPVGRNIRQVLEQPYQKIQADLRASLGSVNLEEILAIYHRTSAGEPPPEGGL